MEMLQREFSLEQNEFCLLWENSFWSKVNSVSSKVGQVCSELHSPYAARTTPLRNAVKTLDNRWLAWRSNILKQPTA